MSTLDERISVACPLPQAAMRLRHFFREHGNSDANTAKLVLRISVDVPGLPTPFTCSARSSRRLCRIICPPI